MLLLEIRRALEKRRRVMENFRNHIGKSSNVEFLLLLSTRGFIGNLDFRHNSYELSIFIKVDSNADKVV
jgi:hypothetical protein